MTKLIKVLSDIPMPARNRRGRPYGATMYPWLEMNIGDSFQYNRNQPHSAAAIATRRYSELNRKYAARRMPDGTYRIWRTE